MVTTKISSQMVKPAEQTPQEIMHLTDCDQIKSIVHTPNVYFYRKSNRKTISDIIQITKNSLSKALVKFYPLAGRLHWSDRKSGRVELHCNSTGALFVEAESDFSIEDFGDFLPNSEIQSLIPSVDFSVIEEVPLLLVQITRLRCGGVAVLTGLSHSVLDGRSTIHFMSEWAKIGRGEDSDDHPFLDRSVLQLQDTENGGKWKSSDFFKLPLVIGQHDNIKEKEKETVALMMKLSKASVQRLKNKANASDQPAPETVSRFDTIRAHIWPETVSRFDTICAHIWKCLTMARGLKPEQETVLITSVDFSNRVNPPLPKRYFGNAVLPLPIRSTAGELLSEPISHVAQKIRREIKGFSEEKVMGFLKCIHDMKDISGIRHFRKVGHPQGQFNGNPNLLVTSWSGLQFYDTANLWGDKVYYMGPGALDSDGRVILKPAPDEDGAFSIPVRVQAEHAPAFKKYFYEEI